MNLKKLQSQDYDYFEDLPDELLIMIFTKLSSADGLNTVNDIKLLGQCSAVSKRFNSLTCLVPTLAISIPFIPLLLKICPKILHKFKHIHSLQMRYQSSTKGVNSELDSVFCILSQATYELHRYCVAVISFSAFDKYVGRQDHHPTRSLTYTNMSESRLYASPECYTLALFQLHHMLVSSIRDHKLLQKLMVNDFSERESFTLLEEQLVDLRNIGTDNVQVEGCEKTGFVDILNLTLPEEKDLC